MISLAIGLFFIFLLLSLLATAIQELIASIFMLRGKNLGIVLQRILETDHVPGQKESFKGKEIGKVIARAFKKPSTTKNEGEDENKTNQPKNLLEEFRDHDWFNVLKPKSDWRHRLVLKGVNPSYLDASTFSTIIIGILQGRGKSLLEKSKQTEIDLQEIIHDLPETKLKGFLTDTLSTGEKTVDDVKEALESWYNNIMDRASGWYKRQTQNILLVIGMILAVSLNADVFKMYTHLSEDPGDTQELVSLAQAYLKDNPIVKSDSLKPNKNDSLQTDSLKLMNIQVLDQQIRTLLNEDLASVATPLGLGWTQSDLDRFYHDKDKLNTSYIFRKLLGFVLTTLAISLGAPFWFDLLKKVVNIRYAGTAPQAPSTNASNQST